VVRADLPPKTVAHEKKKTKIQTSFPEPKITPPPRLATVELNK